MSILNILFNTVFVLSQLIITNACTYCSCSVGKYAELGSGPAYYSDCLDIYTANTASQNGAYSINPNGQGAFQVYCDFTHTGGPWNVFRKFNPPKSCTYNVVFRILPFYPGPQSHLLLLLNTWIYLKIFIPKICISINVFKPE